MRRSLLGAFLCLVLSSGCASLRGAYPTRMLVQQRGECDCAVAGLAMITGSLYEAVAIHVPPSDLEGQPPHCGLTTFQVVSIAARMGVTLRYIDDDEKIAEQVNPRKHEGALVITSGGTHHLVFISEGRVYDPLREWPMEWEDYVKTVPKFQIGVFIYRLGRFTPKD